MAKFNIHTDDSSDALYFIPADPYLQDEGIDNKYSTEEPYPLEWEVETDEPRTTDMINHPPHYTSGGIETIDYMQAKSTPEEFKGHLRLTALKYLSRAGQKDDILMDYEKALWYLLKLIDVMKTEKNG